MLRCPIRGVLLRGLVTLGLFPTSPVNTQNKGWRQQGWGARAHLGYAWEGVASFLAAWLWWCG